MGTYKNPKTRAKSYKKRISEKAEYQKKNNQRIQKDIKNKDSKKDQNKKKSFDKSNNKNNSKKDYSKSKKTINNKPKQKITVVKHKSETRKYVPCAHTITSFNSKKYNDLALVIMIPVRFRFMSNKLMPSSVMTILNFMKSNPALFSKLSNEAKQGFMSITPDNYTRFIAEITASWKKNKFKYRGKKNFLNRSAYNDIFFYKYKHRWHLMINISSLLWKYIDFELRTGIVEYKFLIRFICNIGGIVGIFDKRMNLIKIKYCNDSIDDEKENDELKLYWNNKDSYGEMCKIYHCLKKIADDNPNSGFDYETFYNECKKVMEFNNIVVKSSPKKGINYKK